MIKKDSSENIVCLSCAKTVEGGSEYCEECLKRGGEKLGFEISDSLDNLTTLRESVDKTVDVFLQEK